MTVSRIRQANATHVNKRPVSLPVWLGIDFMQEKQYCCWVSMQGFKSVNICFKLAKLNNLPNFVADMLSLNAAF